MAKKQIYLGIPTYDGTIQSGIMTAIKFCGDVEYYLEISRSSFLTYTFNTLWCSALNLRSKGITHFAMLHADILPDVNWLQTLSDEMDTLKCDVLSAVSPIKDSSGETSTAFDADGFPEQFGETDQRAFNVRKLPLSECHERGRSFTDPKLLVNTGLMLVDITKPWVEKVRFRVVDVIHKLPHGFQQYSMSEDWCFSRDARMYNAKIYATNAVKLWHVGRKNYSNAN